MMGLTGQQQGFRSMGKAGSPVVSPAGRLHSILVGTAHTEGPPCGAGSPGGVECGLERVPEGHRCLGKEERGPERT